MTKISSGYKCILKAVCTLLLLCVSSATVPAATYEVTMHVFEDIYEPSTVIQLSNGKILIGEDEGDEPLFLFSVKASKGMLTLEREHLKGWEQSIDDLEGGALGKNGEVFLITSHSTKIKGKRKKKREKILSLEVVNNKIQGVKQYGGFIADLQKAAKESPPGSFPDTKTFNIEALAFTADRETLLVGLRLPLTRGLTHLIEIENPYAIFEDKGASARLGQLFSLDLERGGVRAMAYDPIKKQFLLANEITGKKDKLRSMLWSWSGKAGDTPVRLALAEIEAAKNIEGMTFVTAFNKRYLLLVCDDGNRKKKRGGHYLFLPADKLK